MIREYFYIHSQQTVFMECSEIRRQFITYYESQGFRFLPRAPMLHPSIPMSFVMSAGLEQVETSLSKTKNRNGNQFVLVQECFRHFDLDTVGTDNIHLSLFEMPGAFTFGKNVKKDTVSQMWELATKIMGINPEHIRVSYFNGGKIGDHDLPEDTLTYQAWQNIGVSEDKLIGLGMQHNLWLQGGGLQNGQSQLRKCGTNTELFYDLGSDKTCGTNCQTGCRCGRFIEFANSLFISHHFDPATNTLIPLNDPFTETVIGTERVAMILQNVSSVFDTEVYSPFIDNIHRFISNTNLPDTLIRQSECVIADHLKALCVLAADGAPPPGKNGRERIIKLLIRSILTRQMVLGISSDSFLSPLIISMIYPNGNGTALKTQEKIKTYFESESKRFQKTIERGKREVEKILANNQGKTLSGSQIFQLEKENGMPHLLIEVMLQEKEVTYSEEEYQIALGKWKQKNSENKFLKLQ